jgi:hypothetical protein
MLAIAVDQHMIRDRSIISRNPITFTPTRDSHQGSSNA